MSARTRQGKRDALEERARQSGILVEPRWGGADEIPSRTLEALVEALGIAPPSPQPRTEAAYVPPQLDSRKLFGVALQLYQLRSPRNFGIGDLGDLTTLLKGFADLDVDFVGLNPLHALFTADPSRASPFSPSDRRFLNPLIIAVDEVPGYAPHMLSGVSIPSAVDEVDYPAVARAKLSVLREIFAAWRSGAAGVPGPSAQARLLDVSGEPQLGAFARFEALSHAMVAQGHSSGWNDWPAPYQDPASAEVAAFAEANRTEVAFHVFLQRIAQTQLRAAQDAAISAGMEIGLYLDLAVGAAPDGAATWADRALVMPGVRVGAPPDLFSSQGQDWGLAPLSPTVLGERGFDPFREVLSAVMGPAGAARIDHAMGLERLFFIPDGMSALDGAYVAMPGLSDILVEESHRHHAIAIGEDLGVVPEGFRERMAARRIFSTRIVPFERDGAAMRPPGRYPPDALACLSTHDLAPLEAWWVGDEIAVRKALGTLNPADAKRAIVARAEEKALLLGLAGLPPARSRDPIDDDLVVAIHRVVARSAARLAAVRLEDVVGGRRLVNLPGTDREHPNWRHTLPLTVDQILASERLRRVCAAMATARP